jgi:hypothetical protein
LGFTGIPFSSPEKVQHRPSAGDKDEIFCQSQTYIYETPKMDFKNNNYMLIVLYCQNNELEASPHSQSLKPTTQG